MCRVGVCDWWLNVWYLFSRMELTFLLSLFGQTIRRERNYKQIQHPALLPQTNQHTINSFSHDSSLGKGLDSYSKETPSLFRGQKKNPPDFPRSYTENVLHKQGCTSSSCEKICFQNVWNLMYINCRNSFGGLLSKLLELLLYTVHPTIYSLKLPHMKMMSQLVTNQRSEWQTSGIARVAIRN